MPVDDDEGGGGGGWFDGGNDDDVDEVVVEEEGDCIKLLGIEFDECGDGGALLLLLLLTAFGLMTSEGAVFETTKNKTNFVSIFKR